MTFKSACESEGISVTDERGDLFQFVISATEQSTRVLHVDVTNQHARGFFEEPLSETMQVCSGTSRPMSQFI